jgi:N-methylhydantoinase B
MKSQILSAQLSEATVDAFTAEVIRSTVVAITDEMKTNLMRTAYNMIIYEAEDFTVGLFDADGNTISIGLGLPMFIRGLSDAIKAKLAHWRKKNIHPGDILLTNDPQVMGSHLNHMIFSLPIFHDGALIAFSSSMGHWQDVGGVLGAVTRDIFSEGLQMPFVKIFKAGKQDMELTEIIRSNCRLPHFAMGDFRAQIAAIRTGERRLTRLIERYGAETFKQSIELIFDQSEKLARAAVEKIPDGVYVAESFMDDDGVNIGKHIPIKIRVEVKADEMTIDLSGVSPQVAGPYNSGATAGRSASEVAFKFLTTPLLLPINEGSFRPLKLNLPPGRVVSATKPAPVRTWMTVPMTSLTRSSKPWRKPVPITSWLVIMPTWPRRAPSVSIPRAADRFISRQCCQAAVGARCPTPTDRTRPFVSTMAIPITRRWKRARGARRSLSPTASCARTRAGRESFAAGSVCRKRSVCSRRAASCRRWSGRSVRPGDCMAARMRWPIAFPSSANTAQWSP